MKEQGITTQEPARACTWAGTEGTGETAWTPVHKAAAVENRNHLQTQNMMQRHPKLKLSALNCWRAGSKISSPVIVPQSSDILF